MGEGPVYLRSLATKDFPSISSWLQDTEFLSTYDYVPPKPMSLLDIISLWMRYLSSEEVVVFALCEKESDKLIGWLGFDEWDKDNGVATLFIGIGDRSMRGKGYGKLAVQELLRYGFMDMNLHKVQLMVLPFNIAGVALYEKTGFQREGILRQMVLREGQRHDLFSYGLLRDEWRAHQVH